MPCTLFSLRRDSKGAHKWGLAADTLCTAGRQVLLHRRIWAVHLHDNYIQICLSQCMEPQACGRCGFQQEPLTVVPAFKESPEHLSSPCPCLWELSFAAVSTLRLMLIGTPLGFFLYSIWFHSALPSQPGLGVSAAPLGA